MSRISPTKRKMQIAQKRKRRLKLAKLRQIFLETKSDSQKEKILAKVKRVTPWLSQEEFLVSVKNQVKK